MSSHIAKLLWPWSKIAGLAATNEALRVRVNRLERDLAAARSENRRLRGMIANAHFRYPKTGRLLDKGVLPS